MSIYYDRQGNPISEQDGRRLFATDVDVRTVARDDVDGCCVSTVHLVINHQYGDGPPLIFETMVFGGPLDEKVVRYSTEDEARARGTCGHGGAREGGDPHT